MDNHVDRHASVIDQGIPRSYFLARLSQDMRLVLARGQAAERRFYQETEEPEMVTKVNVQDSLLRLSTCPICGKALVEYDDTYRERWCEADCGSFSIIDVYSDGDVGFSFIMTAPEKQESNDNAEPSVDGVRQLAGGVAADPDHGVVSG